MAQSELERERYEARLKAQRDQISFLEAAETRGEARGELFGRIHLCQRLLRQPLTPRDLLLAMSADECQRLAEQLEKQLAGTER